MTGRKGEKSATMASGAQFRNYLFRECPKQTQWLDYHRGGKPALWLYRNRKNGKCRCRACDGKRIWNDWNGQALVQYLVDKRLAEVVKD